MLGQSSVGSAAAKIIALKAKTEAAIKQIRGFCALSDCLFGQRHIRLMGALFVRKFSSVLSSVA